MRNNKFKVEFEENREVKINFDLYEFLNNQEQIFLKHQPPTCNNTSLEKFDKIFINLIEEMYEVKEEILKSNKNMNTKESIREELVDVINYVGTSITVFFEEYKSELKKDILPSELWILLLSKDNFDIYTLSSHLNKLFFENIMEIIDRRRAFSERKWHKPVDPSEDIVENVKQLVLVQRDYLNLYLKVLYSLCDKKSEADNLIKQKQKLILDLPKLN